MTLTISQKCGALFMMGLVLDILQTLHITACASRDIIVSVSSLLAVYMIGFWGHNWFVEHKSPWTRWSLTVSGALGACLGNSIALLLG